MSQVFCIGYSDFGYLLSDNDWSIRQNDLTDMLYGLYEDELSGQDFVIHRRYLANTNNQESLDNGDEDSEHGEILELPEEIDRVKITYKGVVVRVIGSYEFESLFGHMTKDKYGLVLVEDSSIVCKRADPENLSEDIVILALNRDDLDNLFD